MPNVRVNGVDLYYETEGSGDPVVFVHGSWTDADSWMFVRSILAESFTVTTYDRRGHTRSERPPGRGRTHEDVEDLAGLIGALGLAPCHVAANSFGGIITLRCAVTYPELFRTVALHEPPMFELLQDVPEAAAVLHEADEQLEVVRALLEAGKDEEGARTFVNTVAVGPGAWENAFIEPVRARFVRNAPTFLDELRDPEQLVFDLGSLKGFSKPLLLTRGTESPPTFPMVLERLSAAAPGATLAIIDGAGHVPHTTHPQELAGLLRDHWAKAR